MFGVFGCRGRPGFRPREKKMMLGEDSNQYAKRLRPSPAPANQGAASAADGDDKSLDSWQEPGPYDPAGRLGPWEDRRAAGKAVRSRAPREAHAEWRPPAD